MIQKFPTISRWFCTILFTYSMSLFAVWYYSAGVYTGPSNLPLGSGLTLADASGGFVVVLTLIALKYLVFDLFFLLLRRHASSLSLTIVFYMTYVTALVIDAVAIQASARPFVDAGFAIFASIVYSPLTLLSGLMMGVIIFAIIWRRRQHS